MTLVAGRREVLEPGLRPENIDVAEGIGPAAAGTGTEYPGDTNMTMAR